MSGQRQRRYDAIVVGGGHNGLTCAAYLARAGMRVCVLERRDILGGACVTEELWPGQRVSRASYVVSMLQPKVVADLRLRDFGYEPIPLDPAFATIAPDGTPVLFFNDAARTRGRSPALSRKDAAAYPEFEELLERMAGFLRPLMLRPPPALGSKRPGDLLSLLREAGRAAGPRARDVHELFRVMTMSVGDLLDEWFESDALKGASASTGVVGVWAGPRTPGTAYNLLHHALGELDGVSGLWGHVRGGMGAHLAGARAQRRGARRRRSAPAPRCARSTCADGRATGVTLADGEKLRAPLVVSGAHPRTTVLDLAGAEHFPDEVVADMRRYRTRGGSVKVNCILSEPPRYEGVSERRAERMLHTGVALCPSVDYLERAWQDAVRGAPARALRRGRGAERGRPDAHRRRHLGDDDVHPVRPATTRRAGRRARARRYADAASTSSPRSRRTSATRSSTPRCSPRPTSSASSGSRRLDLPGRAGPRPDGVHAPVARARPLRDARRRPLPVRRGHPPGRRRHGRLGHNAAKRVLKDRRGGAAPAPAPRRPS